MSALEQMAFDIDTLIAEANPRPPYTGEAPLHFTVHPYTPGQFADAEDELRQSGHQLGLHVGPPHIWHHGYQSSSGTPDHMFTVLMADLSCGDGRPRNRPCYCVGDHIYRGHCECGWDSPIYDDENPTIAAWHDHAWPGWRHLPVIPHNIQQHEASRGDSKKGTNPVHKWITTNYPTDWTKPGAPILTERAGIGTRSVPDRSPWGGYDISTTALAVEVTA